MLESAVTVAAAPQAAELTHDEFSWICQFLHEQTGILLKEGKQALVKGRLERRLRYYGLTRFSDYFASLGAPGNEVETALAIDLLTTNETSFLREPAHFEYLKTHIIPMHAGDRPFRIWSAASSTGEEAYTMAMILADALGDADWEVVGTDISTRVVDQATRGVYPISASERLPQPWLKRYCHKGKDEYYGLFGIKRAVRERVQFYQANLMQPLPALGSFDVIFLRNVMIYFDVETRVNLVERILQLLRPGGFFLVSHSESLQGITKRLQPQGASIYRLPER